MAEGLKAAFGGAPPPQRSSVHRVLQEKTGSRLDLHLHDRDEESDVPVKIDDEAKALRDPSGRYQVLGEIGRGGVGVVYKGRDQDLGRDVAIKVLRPEHVSRPEILERFVEEAQIGGQLQHPGIVPVYEIGLQAGERPYFAMKLVKGHTLAELLARRKGPDDDRRRFLGIFEQVCQTIAYAHARRVVHRDLKPQNVMLGSFGEVQVVDWGFAKVLPLAPMADGEGPAPPKAPAFASVIATVRSDPKKGSHSVAGSMMGTPAYMPPEQALGDVEHMDQRSDVFGLGAMLCEILTGQPPYLAADDDLVLQAARADLQGAYTRLEKCGADAVLIALCRQCLSPARQKRPDSAKQVAEAVAQYLTSVEDRARQAQIHAAEAKVKARSTLMLSAAALLVLALGGGGYLYLQREAQTRQDQANQRVAAALNDANVRLGEARSKEPPDLSLWSRAADAATQAGQLASEADVGGEERSRASQMLATVHDEQSRAIATATRLDKDVAMQQRLLEVRTERLDEQRDDYMQKEHQRRERGYAAAFATYLDGRDLTTLSRDQSVPSLSGRLAVELASGLDCWCASRRSLVRLDPKSPPDPEITARLNEVASTIDPDPWRLRLRAALAAKDRDHDAIVALYREADLATLPAASLLLLASTLADVADPAAAQAVYERACTLFPTNFACILELGLLHLNSGHFAQAEPCFRIAHALRPDMHEPMHLLGKAFTGLGEHPAEERIFRRLAELQPEVAHWPFHVGLALAAQGRFDEALASHQHALELDPKEALYYINIGLALDGLGRLNDAIAICRRALEVDPQNAGVYTNLGNALLKQGRLDDATASFQRAVELAPKDAHCQYNLGRALVEQGKLDEGVPALQRAIELDPKEPRLYATLGSAFTRQGRLDQGVANARRAIELEPKEAGFHYDLAIALGLQNKAADAVASYRRAIELDPTDARYFMNLGNVLLVQNDPDAALASFRRAASLWSEKHDAYAVEWHAKATQAIAKLEPAIDQRNQLLATLRGERESKDAAELCAAADLGYARGESQLAILAFQHAIELDPKQARYHLNLGVAFEQLGRLDDAVASYDRSIELEPKNVGSHLNLGNALLKKGELEDAIAAYRESVELDPKYVTGWVILGRALGQNGDAEEAIQCARKAAELAPAESGPALEVANALFSAGRVEDAIACVRKVLEADPNAANAHHSLGAIMVNSHRLKDALPSYRKAVELAPDRAPYHLDLALVLDDLGQHDAALEGFRKAVELDPTNAVAHYKLGWCLQDKHRYDEAIEHYRAAIENDPNHAEAHCNLASCLQDTGHYAEAVTYCRRGHELGSKRSDWSYPSAEWVRTAERRAALEAKLPALFEGKVRPKDNAERFEYAIMCQIKKYYHASAQLFAEAFAADPKLIEQPGSLYNSAFSPVLAAAGRGQDASQLDDRERARLRKQALDWLRTDLGLYAKKMKSGKAEDRTAAQDALRQWQEEADFASVRDSAALALLSAEERDAFSRLWADVADLLKSR
jgi:serine/threonine-protein kinase